MAKGEDKNLIQHFGFTVTFTDLYGIKRFVHGTDYFRECISFFKDYTFVWQTESFFSHLELSVSSLFGQKSGIPSSFSSSSAFLLKVKSYIHENISFVMSTENVTYTSVLPSVSSAMQNNVQMRVDKRGQRKIAGLVLAAKKDIVTQIITLFNHVEQKSILLCTKHWTNFSIYKKSL